MSFLIPFLISALMGMGLGGGGLLIIYLTLYLGTPQLLAQGTNLTLFIIAGASSLLYHLRKRNVDARLVALMIVFGSIGSVSASYFLSGLDPKYARISLGVLLIISGLYTIYNTLIKRVIKKFKKTLYK